jgi:hypothetical protein
VDPTEQQRPRGLRGGEVEISAAEFSFGSLLDRTHNVMLATALEYAARARPVFPCIEVAGPKEKAPYWEKGTLENGCLDATTDPDLIKKWWTRRPNAMIGAPPYDDELVLDVDPRKGGSLQALQTATGPLPMTRIAISGRNDGGAHLYFKKPAGPLTSTRLPAGIDLKAGGYVIVPPSIHPATGQPYRWHNEDAPVVEMPARLAELLRPAPSRPIVRSSSNASAIGLLRTVVGAPEGNRNNVLYWASCRAAESGILDDQVEALLINAAVTAGETDSKARRTVASARRTMT